MFTLHINNLFVNDFKSLMGASGYILNSVVRETLRDRQSTESLKLRLKLPVRIII